ncbi:SR-related and CTD-associated factor 4 [Aplysia californica]|uniref:SR-related and CTD-associated factor 4 n=1 Tax=Aplysia californica TaxID=6500 RepID=A0ABM0JMI6_APLCA|nr:SR-related and CTD-associated factor 4 [Aplysia californica]
MDAVRSFNNELSSLYESRPPVSRAKMAQVTKCAIKGIKFYKHVVQSVEKFIQKCKPEYKVPGLYVIDSIVRQSRHQFGPEKDVFSPRFTKNIVNTFTFLFKCPAEERSRVVRVLNLWQKNSVFPMEVIQPLLDLAADPTNTELVAAAQRSVDAVVSMSQKVPLPNTHSSSNGGDSNQLVQQTEMLSTITKLLQQAQDGSMTASAPESQLQQLQHLQQQLVMQTERISKPQQEAAPAIDSNLLAQIQTLTNQLLSKTSGNADAAGDAGKSSKPAEPLFNKKLLDFDYGDSDEDDDHQHHHHHHQHPPPQQRPPPLMMTQPPPGMPPVMQDPGLLQQIQQMSQQTEELQSEIGAQEQLRRRLLEQQQQQFDREIGQAAFMGQPPPQNFMGHDDLRGLDEQEDDENRDGRDRGDRRRRRGSRDRSRSPRRRRRSRSRSRDRRRRSRSRDRHRRSRSRERDSSRRDREKERERRKKGLPDIKDQHISICTTTLWFGHLTKHTTEEELREHIEKYGTIKTINMIPPRGCAFVCLTRRKDAFKALDRLKGVKVNTNALKVAWAPGIGVKESMYKNLWDVEQGVTYIPWEQLPADITPFLDGGMVDEDTLPDRLRGINNGEDDGGDDQQQQQQQQPQPPQQLLQQQQQQQPPPQPDQSMDNEGMHGMESMMQQQQLQMGMPRQPPNFPPGGMPGQNAMNLLGPGGPLNMMGRPPMDMRHGGPMGPMGRLPGMGGPRPGMPGGPNMRPGGPMNLGGPQGGMLGQGNQLRGPGPRMDTPPPGMGMNSPNPRGAFPQMGAMSPRFPQMGGPGGMRPPFFNNNNNNNNDNNMSGMGDSDMRGGMVEPKEWPPDDEVNAEDEPDEDSLMDSDERMLPLNAGQRMPPGMNIRAPLGNPFGPRGPLNASGPMNAMLAGMSRAQAPSAAGMSAMLSLRMMPPGQQQQMLAMAGGPGPGFALAPGGVRLPVSAVGVRPGLMSAGAPTRLLPQSSGGPLPVAVSMNGSVVVSRPTVPVSSTQMNNASPDIPLPSSERPPSRDDDSPHSMLSRRSPNPLPLMQMAGNNRPSPGGPILGRGFAPMTIRPRGGPGLLGLRPGAQGGTFSRFGAPAHRPMMGGFGGMDRPAFGGRFGAPFRPPVGFMDHEDKDERRMLPRLDVDERSGDIDERSVPKSDEKDRDGPQKDVDERRDVDEREKVSHRSGRPSRWSDANDTVDVDVPEPVVPAAVEPVPMSESPGPDVVASPPRVASPVEAVVEPTPVVEVPQVVESPPPCNVPEVETHTSPPPAAPLSAPFDPPSAEFDPPSAEFDPPSAVIDQPPSAMEPPPASEVCEPVATDSGPGEGGPSEEALLPDATVESGEAEGEADV